MVRLWFSTGHGDDDHDVDGDDDDDNNDDDDDACGGSHVCRHVKQRGAFSVVMGGVVVDGPLFLFCQGGPGARQAAGQLPPPIFLHRRLLNGGSGVLAWSPE